MSRQLMANKAAQEIEKINKYERECKIKTNKSKFKIVSMAVKKKGHNIVQGTQTIQIMDRS